LRRAVRNFLDSASDNVAADSAASVLSASRSTAVRTNAANGSPAKAAARPMRPRSFSDTRRSSLALAFIETSHGNLRVRFCTVPVLFSILSCGLSNFLGRP